jgi:predicted lipoprotein with Yx(FWY)xxD motif
VAEPFLVDDQGRVLYLFTNDTQNSGTSACTGDCLAAWPAVVATGSAVAGEGVDESLLGTITRDDGTMQLTYNGWPLYYYASDVAPGDMTGQGMNNVWYIVSGTGTAIQP